MLPRALASRKCTHRGAQAHDHKVKGLALYRLSLAGLAGRPILPHRNNLQVFQRTYGAAGARATEPLPLHFQENDRADQRTTSKLFSACTPSRVLLRAASVFFWALNSAPSACCLASTLEVSRDRGLGMAVSLVGLQRFDEFAAESLLAAFWRSSKHFLLLV